VLAAINQVETDYGRDLATSSAGAVGWMQFLPSTWRRWGVAATGNGIADPYNPVDAIFSAARYLQAAGAATNLPGAIYAYNHAGWYVQSVLLRARLIGAIPNALLGALSQLVFARFPIAAKSTYKTPSASATNPAQGITIHSIAHAPVIAVTDGRILRIGQNRTLGRYVVLEDQTGNTYTYSQLGSIQARYPVLKAPHPEALQNARALADIINPPHPPITQPASAGHQPNASGQTKPPGVAAANPSGVAVKERLFADPSLPGSYAAGGAQQLSGPSIQSFDQYFAETLHLAKDQYTLARLRPGAQVIAGTILGHLSGQTPHLYFQIRPAGPRSPLINPAPILQDWQLLAASAAYQAAQANPFFGQSKNPTVGQTLLETKTQITRQTLADPNVHADPCTRAQIKAGQVDPRILKAIEYLSLTGLHPTVQTTTCASNPTQSATPNTTTIQITQINGQPITKDPNDPTTLAIQRLLTLQGALAPTQIQSPARIPGQPTTTTSNQDNIQITYTPTKDQAQTLLKPSQWLQLITRISQIPQPTIPTTPNPYDIRTNIS
jgi:hypothetical protein